MTAAPTIAVRRLTIARTISVSGGGAAYIALMFSIYERTGSPAWLAATAVLTFGTEGMSAPFTGWIGDRFDRRRVMIVSDLLGALCFGAMALAGAPWLLLVFAFLSAVAETPFWAASAAAIPNLVGEESLSRANGTLATGSNLGIMLGPILGGALLAQVGPGLVFGLNALTFLVSAALVASVRGRFADQAAPKRPGLMEGFRFLARDPVLVRITAAWSVLVFATGMSLVADVPLADALGVGSIGFGAMVASWGLGSVAGAFGSARILSARSEPKALMVGAFVGAVGTAWVGLSPWFLPILVAIVVAGLGESVMEVASRGILQRRAPDEIRARVDAASDAVIHTAFAISFVLGGFAVHAIGPRATYVAGGVGSALAGLILAPLSRRARRLPRSHEAPVEAAELTELGEA